MMLRTTAATSMGPRYEGSVMPMPLSQLTSSVPAPMDTVIRMLAYITVSPVSADDGACKRVASGFTPAATPVGCKPLRRMSSVPSGPPITQPDTRP